MSLRTSAVLLLLIIHSSLVWSQKDSCQYTLKGHILDRHNEEQLGFAHIYIKELEKGVSADVEGYYQFNNLCNGRHTIRVSHLGCSPIDTVIVVKGNTHIDFYPEHHQELLDEFSVIEYRDVLVETNLKEELNKDDIQKMAGKDLAGMLEDMNGVNTYKTGANIQKPVLNGLQGNRVVILNNGVRLEAQQWGDEHAPEIDPLSARKITVVRGAGSVKYGPDAMGGAIVVEDDYWRSEKGFETSLISKAESNGRGGIVAARVDLRPFKAPLSMKLQGSFKRFGNRHTPDYFIDNSGMKELNFSGGLKWQKKRFETEVSYSQYNTDLAIFKGSHFGNLTDLNRLIETGDVVTADTFAYTIGRPFQHVEHEQFKAKAGYELNAFSRIVVQYGRQYNLRQEFDKDLPLNNSLAALNLPEVQYEITTHSGRLFLNTDKKDRDRQFGVDGKYQENTYEGRFFIPNYQRSGAGAFWIENRTFGNWRLEAGVRGDWLQQYTYIRHQQTGNVETINNQWQNGSFSLGGKYTADSVWLMSINVGSGWRAPAANELFSSGLHHGAASLEQGDPNLKAERNINSTLLIQAEKKRHTVYGDAFLNRINNFIYLNPTGKTELTIRGAFPLYEYEQADVLMWGWNLNYGYALTTNLQSTITYHAVRGWNYALDDYQVRLPADRFRLKLDYEMESEDHKKQWSVSLGSTYVLKQTRVPKGVDFMPPPEAFFLLNASVAYNNEKGKLPYRIAIGCDNLFNQNYRSYLNRFRYFTDETGRNIYVSIQIKFNQHKHE